MTRFYKLPKISGTIDIDHIKKHYYESHSSINPSGIVPAGPSDPFGLGVGALRKASGDINWIGFPGTPNRRLVRGGIDGSLAHPSNCLHRSHHPWAILRIGRRGAPRRVVWGKRVDARVGFGGGTIY